MNRELGLHFYPSDIELLELLRRKVKREENPSSFVIERNLYGSESPCQLFHDGDPWEREYLEYEKKDRKVLHVFTKLSYLTSKRIKRTSGGGTWSGDNKGKNITWGRGNGRSGNQDCILGLKKLFKFKPKSCSTMSDVEGSNWIMYEYSLAETTTQTEFVICKIIRTRPKSLAIPNQELNDLQISKWTTEQLEYAEFAESLLVDLQGSSSP